MASRKLGPAADESMHLVRYDAMCTAIAECHRVDEAKDIRDKARALEVYAQQARNTEAERKAAEVRLRAERRAGELLKELTRAEAGSVRNPSGRRGKEPVLHDETLVTPQSELGRALEESGISRGQAFRYQRLAAVPEDVFENALADPVQHPTAARIVREASEVSAQTVRQLDEHALRVWKKASDFERQRDAVTAPPVVVFPRMTPAMKAEMHRIVPALAAYWRQFEEVCHEHV